MKNLKRLIGMAVFAIVAVPMLNVSALEANNEETLKAALEAGGEVTLTSDVEVNAPLYVSKDVVLNGGDFTISAGTSFVNDGPNGSIIAVNNNATLTLNNVKLNGAKKYGVQAYAGGNVVFNKATITNSGFGAVLLNGGAATIIDLTMNANAYGIEFGQGVGVNNTPSLTMNGVINGSQDELLVLAENDNLGEVIVKNEEGSTMKLATDGKTLVLKDANGDVVATSNEAKDGVTVNGDETIVEPTPTPTPNPTPTPKPDEKPSENPETFDGIATYIALAILGFGALVISSKKVFQA